MYRKANKTAIAAHQKINHVLASVLPIYYEKRRNNRTPMRRFFEVPSLLTLKNDCMRTTPPPPRDLLDQIGMRRACCTNGSANTAAVHRGSPSAPLLFRAPSLPCLAQAALLLARQRVHHGSRVARSGNQTAPNFGGGQIAGNPPILSDRESQIAGNLHFEQPRRSNSGGSI